MRQMSVREDRSAPPWGAATEPVGGLDGTLPIRPDQGSSRPLDDWRERMRRRRQRKPLVPGPETKVPEGERRIDDFA